MVFEMNKRVSWPNVEAQSQCWQGVWRLIGHFVNNPLFCVDKAEKNVRKPGETGHFSPFQPNFSGIGRTISSSNTLPASTR
jgi:muconolactone delta-isomerase